MTTFRLAIFDMDGTLIDSEPLAARAIQQTWQDVIGEPLPLVDPTMEFKGLTVEGILENIRVLAGGALPDAFLPELSIHYDRLVRTELEPVTGADEAIRSLGTLPKCVASNGEPQDIKKCLELTGLLDHFGDNWFSARDVERPKPDPDLFLYAAERNGVAPERCIVLEDSRLGLRAAIAAGMTAVAYAGGGDRSQFEDFDISIVDDIRQFAEMARPSGAKL